MKKPHWPELDFDKRYNSWLFWDTIVLPREIYSIPIVSLYGDIYVHKVDNMYNLIIRWGTDETSILYYSAFHIKNIYFLLSILLNTEVSETNTQIDGKRGRILLNYLKGSKI